MFPSYLKRNKPVHMRVRCLTGISITSMVSSQFLLTMTQQTGPCPLVSPTPISFSTSWILLLPSVQEFPQSVKRLIVNCPAVLSSHLCFLLPLLPQGAHLFPLWSSHCAAAVLIQQEQPNPSSAYCHPQ